MDLPPTNTTTLKRTTLNPGQRAAADGFFSFLLSQDKEMIISGPGGVGKTYLMGKLIDEVIPEYHNICRMMGKEPEYSGVVMTATTNKAAAVLALATKRPTETIHSFMNLKVQEDYSTGRSKLERTRSWKIHENLIIFVDECSMIDTPLYRMIQEGTHKCKIIYVGDHCQLAPVTEKLSPVYTQNLPFYELTQPMRNAGQPALMEVCQQLRETVEGADFKPIQVVPGVIDLLSDDEMEFALRQTFHRQTLENRVLAYTNEKVTQYTDFIREIRGLTGEYLQGEMLVNNQAIRLHGRILSVEEEVEIIQQNEQTEQLWITNENGADVTLEVRHSSLRTRLGGVLTDIPLAVDRAHYAALLKYFSRKKNWHCYFNLKGQVPDLRPRDAATIHKAQGSTHDQVFIDLGDLSTCRQPDVVARLLYVAFTRARNRVFLYGQLAEKYGGLII